MTFRPPIIVTITPPQKAAEPTYFISSPALLTPNPAQPFVQNDWPGAVAAFKPAQVDAVELFLPLHAVTNPFSNSTETRIFALQVVKADIIVNLLPLQAPPPVSLPFSLRDWPNAIQAQQKIGAESFSADLSFYAPNPSVPFSQFDWPLPVFQTVQSDRSFESGMTISVPTPPPSTELHGLHFHVTMGKLKSF